MALALLLAAFSVATWRLERTQQLRRLDADLQRKAQETLHTLGPQRRPPGGGFGAAARNDPVAYYFVLFDANGRVLRTSDRTPGDIPPPEHAPDPERGLVPVRQRGDLREAWISTPRGDRVVVGCSTAAHRAALRRLALVLAGGSTAVLLAGWFLGWWIIGRALRPIRAIGATAAGIARGDLSQRIPESESASELGQLTAVLNATFARLDEAFAQQRRFTANAAHELRTPVTVLLTQAQSTLTRARTAEEYQEAMDLVVRTSQRMRRLIESLLELARLDAGQEPLRRARIDLAMIAAECVELLRPLADVRNVKIRTELPETFCEADPDRIAQVVTNLVANAIHYNRPAAGAPGDPDGAGGGEVRVRLSREEGFAVLAVANTGIGISAGDLPHVFERFFRADKARSRSADRTGLGLAIVQSIVEAHGGTVAVESREGHGATFTIRLPG